MRRDAAEMEKRAANLLLPSKPAWVAWFRHKSRRYSWRVFIAISCQTRRVVLFGQQLLEWRQTAWLWNNLVGNFHKRFSFVTWSFWPQPTARNWRHYRVSAFKPATFNKPISGFRPAIGDVYRANRTILSVISTIDRNNAFIYLRNNAFIYEACYLDRGAPEQTKDRRPCEKLMYLL